MKIIINIMIMNMRRSWNNKRNNKKTSKIGSFVNVRESKDVEGLTTFYYLVQDLKCFVFALISSHFKVNLFHYPSLSSL